MARFPTRYSLRLILIMPFVLQVFGIVGLVGGLSFRNGQRAVNDLASQLRAELTNRIEQQLRGYVSFPFVLTQINATSLQRGDLDVANLDDAYPLWQQMRNSPANNLIYCGREADGAFLGVGQRIQADSRLFDIQQSNTSTDYLFHYYPLDGKGQYSRRDRVGDRPYDPRIRPWYEAAEAQKAPVWSAIYLDFDERIPVITASQPVFAQDTGQLLGVCAVDFLPSLELNQFLSSLEIGTSGETFIMERSGTLVASSTATEEALLIGEDDDLQRIQASESQNPLVSQTALFLNEQFMDLSQIQNPQQVKFGNWGDRQFVQVAPFQDGRGLDWLIVVVLPEADFMAQINANTRNTLILCVGALAIAILLGIQTARWIIAPILHLSAASQTLAQQASDANLGRTLPIDAIQSQGIREIEVLAQSFAQMAQQLQAAFGALETTNANLEQRVAQRTLELQDANAKILALNQQLRAENVRMGAELDVARQMQQMILPRDHELTNVADLDIAGFMEVATEVGGDYYDIIQNDGRVIIGIGDVTGHGLKSGVLMLMVQTAVRTLLASEGEDLTRCLALLNRVIYDNTQRLSPGRNLTLVLLDYRDGLLRLSGQHEEVIVVRAGGHIERVDTLDLGFPLGMVENIEEFINQIHLQLDPGDGVVLYTDGITESENQHRQLYGIDRLLVMIQTHWNEPAQSIVQAIMHDVWIHIDNHTVFDDLTLIVIKRQVADLAVATDR